MRWISIALSALAAASGLLAARYWLHSTKVTPDPGWGLPGSGRATEPTNQSASNTGWVTATLTAFSEVAELNRKAAYWTAISAALTGLSALVSAVAN